MWLNGMKKVSLAGHDFIVLNFLSFQQKLFNFNSFFAGSTTYLLIWRGGKFFMLLSISLLFLLQKLANFIVAFGRTGPWHACNVRV